MAYRILIDPTLTPQQQTLAAHTAVAAHVARQRTEDAQIEAERTRKTDLASEMQRHQARWEREEKERAKQGREQADKVLAAELRGDFFAKNPNASEADFARLLPQLRDEFMIRRMNEASQRRAAMSAANQIYRPL